MFGEAAAQESWCPRQHSDLQQSLRGRGGGPERLAFRSGEMDS